MIKGVREIFKNDMAAIKNNPVVIFVLMAIILIPSLYALLNLEATWDPYSLTSNIPVAVVNGDMGYDYNGAHYNVGNSLIDELKTNNNFKWQFVDKKTAMDGVKNGKYYAALLIPGNFSQEIFSVDTSHPHSAKIEYIVNDKLNAVAPRMTNVGADAIQTKINNEVIKTIDGIIFGKLSDAGQKVAENKAAFLKAKTFINELNGNLGKIDATLTDANSVMNEVNSIWPNISASLPEIQKESNYIRKTYDMLYSQISSNPQQALATVQRMELMATNTIKALNYINVILTSLYNTTGDQQLKPVIDQVEDALLKANTALNLLKEIETDIENSNDPTSKLEKLKISIDQMDDVINTLANNKETINIKINDASSKLGFINSKWPEFRSTIPIAATKLNSINEADINRLIVFSDVNQDDLQNYFKSPVELEKEHMYPVKNYGSALSPFYISVSLWIGCIIAVAMISLRVKSRKKYSSESVYLGRMGLFLIISILQALVVAIGALFLQVQVTSALLFTLTTLYIGLCCMVLIYSLSSAFGNVGKALAIIILVLQITATGGVFPVEILPKFFQIIHPYLPLTYSIGALREVVAGVMWNNYWYCMGVLTMFPVLAFGLTLLIKEKMDKRAQWTENKLKESGLF